MSASSQMELRRTREAILAAHAAAESAHDLDAVIATFHRPRYEIVPTGEVFDGEDAVRRYHGENFAGIPDLTVEPIAAHHGDDAVAEEAWVSGTHLGTYHGLPPTGRHLRIRVCGIYVFERDQLVCERVYYDLLTVLRGLGIARDPNSLAGQITVLISHPIHIGRTFGRHLLRGRVGPR